MPRSKRLLLEQLESREVLTVFGVPWPDGSHLTLSFEPDGTSINGAGSNLFSELNSSMPSGTWQKQILKAFQTWAIESNLNIGIVADSGAPNGVSGGPSGDGRFGDIRIGGITQPTARGLVETSPFSVLSGTWSGDSIVNTSAAFNVGGGSGAYDLFTAYLQEAGHVFGIGNSELISSVMYENYIAPRFGLSDDDIASVQALYGTRAPDQYEVNSGNNTLGSSTRLSVGSGVLISADVTTTQDVDFYRLTNLSDGGTISIRLQTQGVSLLQGRITVFKNGVPISSMAASDINQNIKLTIPNVDTDAVYTVSVQSGTGDVFGIGAYELVVKPSTNSDPTGDGTIWTTDYRTNDSFYRATNLSVQQISTVSGFSYSYNGVLSAYGDVDYYKLASNANNVSGGVMTVMVWTQGSNRVDPTATVYDRYQNPVDVQVLVNQNGEYVLQIANATSAYYYVKVQAAKPYGSHSTGNYFLGVQFGDRLIQADESASRTLTTTSSSIAAPLVVADTRLLHFSLNVSGASALDAIRLTIFNQNQQVVTSVYTATGGTVTFNILLTPGTYYLGMGGGQTSGAALSSAGATFTLGYSVMSDPIDPPPADPTGGGNNPPPGPLNPTTGPWDTYSPIVPPPPPPVN
ncbi:hypothetical protein BH10PLA2_BH10PLA2_26720 [soil metagenome]